MAITDTIFVFLFLPISLVLFYMGKENIRKYILLALSLLFYACGSVEYFLLLLVSLVINVLAGCVIDKLRGKKGLAMVTMWIGILYNIFILGYYKYADFILTNVGNVLQREFEARNLLLPLGISFFTFKAISYLVDVYQGKIEVKNHLVDAALYLSFFAQIQSGPLSRYNDMYKSGFKGAIFEGFSDGVYRFIIGFNKKILLSNILAKITQETFAMSSTDLTAPLAWLGAVCYTMQLFYDFSGYSDMAIGISKMFGFDCPENFNYPYMTKSVSEFWRRWHITLGSWFRDYIYIPLGGSRVKNKMRLYVNLLAVWLFTGIWHGASWNFVFWGLAYFVAIAFEKTTGWPNNFKSKPAKVLYRVGTLFFISFMWVIFRSPGLLSGLQYIRNMLCCSISELADMRALFLLKDNLVFIVAAVIFCFPILPWIEKKIGNGKYGQMVWNVAIVVVNGALFIWALSYVVAGQNNPFAYANF